MAVSANDALAAVELEQGYQIFRLAPMDKLPESGPPPAFGEPLDAASGYRLLQNLSVERQVGGGAHGAVQSNRKQDTFPARCHCMADYGGEEVARIRAHRMLLSRNRYSCPGDGRVGIAGNGRCVATVAGFVLRHPNRAGTRPDGMNPAAQRMGKNWPKDWKREDILRFSAWTLQKLEAFGYDQVAPIYRKQLQSDGFSYTEQLDALPLSAGSLRAGKKFIERLFKKRFHWQNEQPSLDRSVGLARSARFLATARR